MSHHIDEKGRFQSDKFPALDPDKIVLSFRDSEARPALRVFAANTNDADLAADITNRLQTIRLSELEPKAEVRCTKCRAEFMIDELEKWEACPRCHTKGVPMSISEDALVRINWHELRILTIWAENWERQASESSEDSITGTIAAICRQLDRFKAEAWAPLTMREEIQDVADGLNTDVSVMHGEEQKMVKPTRRH